MLPDGGTGGQEKSDQRKGENRKGNKAEKRKQRRTEEKERQKKKNEERQKKKTHRRKTDGVPWHTMCPVIFAPTVPAPGRFSFSLFHSSRGALPLPRHFRFSFRTQNPVSLTHFRFLLPHSVRGALPLSNVSVFRSAFFRPPGTGRIPV